MTPFVLPIRVRLNGSVHDVGRLVLNEVDGRTDMAFRYSTFWLHNGFALGADLPLDEGVIYPESDGVGAFGFVRDAMPCDHAKQLLEAMRLNDLKSDQNDTECLPGHLWALDTPKKHRFSAFEFPLTHSFETIFHLDLKQRKTALNFVRLLEGLPQSLQKSSPSELTALMAGCFPLPGRRPKTLVTYGPDAAPFLLRVRSRTDAVNTPLWAHLTQTLAGVCGLDVLPSFYEPIGTDGVHLEPRFDRVGSEPLFCLSARTLCRQERLGGPPVGYLDVADVINAHGVRPKRDLKELFGRMLFDTLTGNQHNRADNIWFYRANGGWNLAPLSAPCIAPTLIRSRLLPMALQGNDTSADPENALLLASYFGLSKTQAKQLLLNMQKSIYRWKEAALRLGADPIEVQRVASSFYQE